MNPTSRYDFSQYPDPKPEDQGISQGNLAVPGEDTSRLESSESGDSNASSGFYRKRPRTGWTIPDQFPGGPMEEGGRTYHRYLHWQTNYHLPNDGEEQDRLDMAHEVWKRTLDGRLYLAPINPSPTHVLDVATGTGVWANEFAERHPTCEVLGTDLSLIQPSTAPNVNFIVEDSENQDWVFPWLFDFIHFRNTMIAFTDTKAVIRRAYNHMKPGAWIEFQETNGTEWYSPDNSVQRSCLKQWGRLAKEGGTRAGIDLSVEKLMKYKDDLAEIGFVDITVRPIMIPGNPSSGRNYKEFETGYLCCLVMLDAVESYRKVIGFNGLSAAEVDAITEQAKADMPRDDLVYYHKGSVTYARKPLQSQ